jgi:endonuclease/exonuclease/phosphatase family metal-dependent hydrolase
VAARFTVKVMSYNTQYIGYPPRGSSRIDQYGAKIREVGAAVVGVQECLDRFALAAASGYSTIEGDHGHGGVAILFDPSKVSYVEGSSGYMRIPRDNYAERFFTWAQFTSGGSAWWFFNTHFPHNHNEATSPNTHARIAQMLLQKFRDLGIESSPKVVVGDFNPFASNGASEGSFESNLVAAGFFRAYKARGNPGFPGLDKIFASSTHWEASNGADHGTGSSDHPAIAADLTLKA